VNDNLSEIRLCDSRKQLEIKSALTIRPIITRRVTEVSRSEEPV